MADRNQREKYGENLKETPLNTARPFFRQESVIGGARHDDMSNPWKERLPDEDLSCTVSKEVKETVLQNEWPEKILGYTDDYKLGDVSLESDDMTYYSDDHYQKINEREMIPIFALKTVEPVVKPPSLPPPLLRHDTSMNRQEKNVDPLIKTLISRKLRRDTDVKSIPLNQQEGNVANNISKEEEKSQCLEYREMVNIFKPLIVQNLLVQDILPSLPFLENHDDIYESMKSHSPKIAVVRLLDELSESEELGKWQKFIDALSANGYTYIVDNIRGYKFVNHEYQKEYIRKLTPKIGKMIVMRELLPYLVALDLISESDKENIEREDANRGNYAAAVLFLGRVHKKHRYWYPTLIKALEDAKMNEVAADLKIPNLLSTERRKVSDVYSDGDVPEYQLPPVTNWSKINMDLEGNYNKTYVPNDQEKVSEKNLSDIPSPFNTYLFSIPPRVPILTREEIGKKRKVPLPIWTNDDFEMFVKEQIMLHSKKTNFIKPEDDDKYGYEVYEEPVAIQKKIHDKRNAVEVYDDIDEQAFKCRLNEKNESVSVPCIDSLKLKQLRSEIADIKQECNERHAEVELLDQMSSLNDKVIKALRKVNKLKKENALKKKEMHALKLEDSEDIIVNEEETQDCDEKTDAYYPSAMETGNDNDITAMKALGSRAKQTIDLRDLKLLEKCTTFENFLSVDCKRPLSVIQIYSPTFKSRKSIYDFFEKDSGIGVDITTEYD